MKFRQSPSEELNQHSSLSGAGVGGVKMSGLEMYFKKSSAIPAHSQVKGILGRVLQLLELQ